MPSSKIKEILEHLIKRYKAIIKDGLKNPDWDWDLVIIDLKSDISSALTEIEEATRRDDVKILEGNKKDTGIKMYPDKRTGEMRYLHGHSPSSQCIGCGQKKKAEEQGYNQALSEAITKITQLDK